MKKFVKDAVSLTVTGVGLGALAGVDESGAVGKMSKALPVVGGVMAAKAVVSATESLLPKKKV